MAPLFGHIFENGDGRDPPSPRAGSCRPMPQRSRNRWAASGLALLAAALLALAVRPSRLDGAACAALAAAGWGVTGAQRSPPKLWRLEEMGVHHYAFPGLLTQREPVVFHVWLKAQQQAGKVLLRWVASSVAS